MRITLCLVPLSLAVAIAALLPACGDDGGLPLTSKDLAVAPLPDLAVSPPDLTVVRDLTVVTDLTSIGDFGGVLCGGQTCGMGQKCCASVQGMNLVQACQASCDADAGAFPIACDGPEDCMGNPCCAMVAINGGGGGMGGAMCTNAPQACQINLAMNAISTRLCHQDADCAGLMLPILGTPAQCCHPVGQANTHICAAPLNFMGFNFQCP